MKNNCFASAFETVIYDGYFLTFKYKINHAELKSKQYI
jgi:hypothetical protein